MVDLRVYWMVVQKDYKKVALWVHYLAAMMALRMVDWKVYLMAAKTAAH
jgi:hypothetical protein